MCVDECEIILCCLSFRMAVPPSHSSVKATLLGTGKSYGFFRDINLLSAEVTIVVLAYICLTWNILIARICVGEKS
jgi:hypothetical protein